MSCVVDERGDCSQRSLFLPITQSVSQQNHIHSFETSAIKVTMVIHDNKRSFHIVCPQGEKLERTKLQTGAVELG